MHSAQQTGLISSKATAAYNLTHITGEDWVTTDTIRDTIKLAKLHEQQHGHLATLLKQQYLNSIHMTIQLPEDNPAQSLMTFVVAYIEQVPRFIDAARAITQQAKIQTYTDPFLHLAEDFFLKPPEVIRGNTGLIDLMDEAYLAHRLIEELNDRFMSKSGIPLVPMDMSMPNLIIHSLIGEPFSNELDAAVCYITERTIDNQHVYDSEAFKVYVAEHKNHQWDAEQQQWPCLTDKLGITLQLPRQYL
jgi:hypothetical protein